MVTTLSTRGRQNRILRELSVDYQEKQRKYSTAEAGKQEAAQKTGQRQSCE